MWYKPRKRMKGVVRQPNNFGAWFGYLDERRRTKVYMNRERAERWMKETGKPVFFVGKKYQLYEED